MPHFFWTNARVAREHGFELTMERFYALAGLPIHEVFRSVAEEQGVLEIDIDSIMLRKEQLTPSNPVPVEAIAPVVDIARAHHGRVPMMVASSGLRTYVTRHLTSAGITHLFEDVVTVEDVARGKPAPDLFLEAARRMGKAPAECLVFEDADLGVQAARAAGMEVVDVRRLE
eukprot:CAMPEP_0119129430 /NCGR_PEP_ID=MMETSP1310-20130426/7180_1 /TAXON_ID=464262 /ORGANISM="Genus nov. species nov., Strain RCC2339" /LENGTH=171 /DNA_ID=CAMNT_0007119849 /DNA_START=60 /DNA_END=572 /DNA_ORIENTATION=+